jgi:alanyl-tRNA synthetase
MLHQLVAIIRDTYQSAYPELAQHYNATVSSLKLEEKRFFDTLERGQRMLEDSLSEAKTQGLNQLSGEVAFKLYDTYGFPLELTQDLAEVEGLGVDLDGYNTALQAQKTLARAGQKNTAMVQDDTFAKLYSQVGKTPFVGYDHMSETATVKALLVDGQPVARVEGTNQPFVAILDRTPFYPESGGQAGDCGSFIREDGHHGLTVVVNDTQKVGELIVHHCLFDNGGSLSVGESLVATVDPRNRHRAALHHTSTHLLQAALRKVLGTSVHQAGSRVTAEGARFDFTFARPVTEDELARVEFIMNGWVRDNLPRDLQEMDMDSARAKGALMMADEKYGDTVRVVAMGTHSIELCGGTHVNRTGDIGLIKITSESAIAAGIRRIELVAGEAAYKAFKQLDSQTKAMAQQLKIPVAELPERLERLTQQLKATEKQVQHLQQQQAATVVKALLNQVSDQGVLITQLPGTDHTADQLRWMTERLSDALTQRVLLLAGVTADNTVAMVASVSDDYIKHGIKAGDLVKQVAMACGGGGGGKPSFAQAGGKDASQLSQALNNCLLTASQLLKA